MENNTVQRIELAEVNPDLTDATALTLRDFGLVKDVSVELEVALGNINLSIEQLFSLKSGEVLSLDKETDQPVDLVLNGNVVATGSLVAVDGVFGIEIDSVKDI